MCDSGWLPRFIWTLFLASKHETFGKFVAFVKKVEKRVGHSLVCLRSDHGTEFENSSFIDYCNEHGVEHNFSAPRTPQQNGGGCAQEQDPRGHDKNNAYC